MDHVRVSNRELDLRVLYLPLRASHGRGQSLVLTGGDIGRSAAIITIGTAETQRDLPLRDRHAPGHERIMSVCVVRGSIVAFFFIRRDRCCAVAPAAAGGRQSRDRCPAIRHLCHADGAWIG